MFVKNFCYGMFMEIFENLCLVVINVCEDVWYKYFLKTYKNLKIFFNWKMFYEHLWYKYLWKFYIKKYLKIYI